MNRGLLKHPLTTTLRKREGRIAREPHFELKRPSDLWALIFDGAADLASELEIGRIRQCEACVVHFFDTSKKGSRRWCSMNICGNKLKVAAYQWPCFNLIEMSARQSVSVHQFRQRES